MEINLSLNRTYEAVVKKQKKLTNCFELFLSGFERLYVIFHEM